MSATVWLPHPAGQPDQCIVIGLIPGPSFASSALAVSSARLLVSMTARLQ